LALSTTSELEAVVADYLNRSDLTAIIKDWIVLAEAEFNRTLRVREMAVRTQAPLSSQYVKLPDDFLGMRNIELVTSPVTPLEYRNPQNIDNYRAEDSAGKPLFYTIIQNVIEVAPVPSDEYTLEILYYRKVPSLALNSTNFILENHPDAYIYGVLMQSPVYLGHDERVTVWAGRYQQIIDQIITSDEKASFSGSTPSIAFQSFG